MINPSVSLALTKTSHLLGFFNFFLADGNADAFFKLRIIQLIADMEKPGRIVEILKARFFWISDSKPPKPSSKSFYFDIDDKLVYQPFYLDFGPLNLSKVWNYVTEVEKLLANEKYKQSQIYHYTSQNLQKAANSAFLVCAFQVICLGMSPEKAFQPFENIVLPPFRDASYGQCSYKCTILDCLKGLSYAIQLGWFRYKTFDIVGYQHYEQVDNGDINWIIPAKFVAFSSPSSEKVDKYGNPSFSPQDYVPIFKKLKIKRVIRLNNKTYDEQQFIKEGIKHTDLFFTDGTPPPPEILDQFLEIAQAEEGAIAVHCKAGLGRTGSLIACYAMKHYHFPAADFIGWIRIARPGSILGPQQQFLIENERPMFERGKNSQIWQKMKTVVGERQMMSKFVVSTMNKEMTQEEITAKVKGVAGQGNYLVEAKLKKQMEKKAMFASGGSSPLSLRSEIDRQSERKPIDKKPSRPKYGYSNPKYSPHFKK